jgi:phosphatidylserine/phosphatidylglycerophosphate/cardiolipin synthase-like enzyme
VSTYENKDLRREILKTLYLAKSSSFKIRILLRALRPTGFGDLSESTLLAEIIYLQKKGFVEIEKATNLITEEKFDLISISPKGIDLLEGNCSDIGISNGK